MLNSVVRHRIANSNLLEYASKSRDEGFFNDLTIIIGNEMVYANRLVLSCHSKYFEGMFKSVARHENIIEIEAVDGATMKTVIDFIYHGSITINDDNVMTLLSGAEYLQLNEVKQFCFEFLEKNEIVLDNLLDIFKMVSKCKKSALRYKVKEYLSISLNKVSQTEKYKVLSKEDLISCISILDRLHVNEASFFQAVVTWTRHREARATEFPELFRMINLENITFDFLEKNVLEEDLVLINPQCRKQALSTYRNLVRTEKSKPNESHLISLGGEYTGIKVTVLFSLPQETPKSYPYFDVEISRHCALNLDGCIYTIGAFKKIRWDNFLFFRTVLKLNLQKPQKKWEKIAELNYCKSSMGASVFCGILFVAGGENYKCNSTTSSEYYIPAINKWLLGPELIQSRTRHCLVSSDGFLYALGGTDGDKYLSSVEMLDDLEGSWQNIQPMQTPRHFFAAVNCNGVTVWYMLLEAVQIFIFVRRLNP